MKNDSDVVLADVQHHLSLLSIMLLSCCCPSSFRSLPHHEEASLERKARLSSRGVQLAMRTSINLHQSKVEEDRQALYHRSLPGFQSTSSCSCSVLHLDLLQTTTVVLTIMHTADFSMTTPTTSAPCNDTTTPLLPQPSTAHERH